MHALCCTCSTANCFFFGIRGRSHVWLTRVARCLPRAGWVAGPIILFAFAWVTYFCSALLIDAYRYPDVDSPQVNYKYIDAVERYMGAQHLLCATCCFPMCHRGGG